MSHSISLLMTQKTKNKRKTTSTTRVACTTHMEILVTYCRVVAFTGSWGGAEKAQVMKNANRAEIINKLIKKINYEHENHVLT